MKLAVILFITLWWLFVQTITWLQFAGLTPNRILVGGCSKQTNLCVFTSGAYIICARWIYLYVDMIIVVHMLSNINHRDLVLMCFMNIRSDISWFSLTGRRVKNWSVVSIKVWYSMLVMIYWDRCFGISFLN